MGGVPSKACQVASQLKPLSLIYIHCRGGAGIAIPSHPRSSHSQGWQRRAKAQPMVENERGCSGQTHDGSTHGGDEVWFKCAGFRSLWFSTYKSSNLFPCIFKFFRIWKILKTVQRFPTQSEFSPHRFSSISHFQSFL